MPLSPSGAELLFEVFSRRYERGSVLVTSNLPFDEWTSVFGAERLTGALLDRLTHHVHILEMNGESYRLRVSRRLKYEGPLGVVRALTGQVALVGVSVLPWRRHGDGPTPPRRCSAMIRALVVALALAGCTIRSSASCNQQRR